MYYSNGFESTYEELKTFYPIYYEDVLEMQAILKTCGKLADDMIVDIDQVINNNFIMRADEQTISNLEDSLKIKSSNKSRPLDERRRLVFSFFVGFGKISGTKIKNMIRALTDASSDVSFKRIDDDGNDGLSIIIDRGSVERILFADVQEVLERKLTAHLAYEIGIRYTFPIGVGAERSVHWFNYELAGTKPDIACLGAIQTVEMSIESNLNNQLIDYKEAAILDAGVYPEISLVGKRNINKASVESIVGNRIVDFKEAAMLDAGIYPSKSNIGDFNSSESAASSAVTGTKFDYIFCGTKFSG